MTEIPGADDALTQTLERALGAQYQLRGLLGRGGMGAVYLAHEPFLQRDVAVKVLTAALSSGDAGERFLREARTAARLSHPNIVPLHTFGHADGRPYYVMSHVDGESLEARLKREGRLPPEEVRHIVSELADALDYAHRCGVVHRDVKPDNVLLDRSTGRAMLTDFGVAKQMAVDADTLTVTGVIVGTPHYMSPEQAAGEQALDGRSDVYALGVLAYRMATGRMPFEGRSLQELIVQQATRKPVPVGDLVDAFPLDVDAAIMRALAKEPTDRWRTAAELRGALLHDDEHALPEELRVLNLEAPTVIFLGTSGIVYAMVLAGGVTALGALALWAGLTLPGTAWVTYRLLAPAARRFGWGQVLRRVVRQPRWWTGWWPSKWRHPGDLWSRLPVYVRGARTSLVATNAVCVPSFLMMLVAIGEGARNRQSPGSLLAFVAVMLPPAAVWTAFSWWTMRRGRAAGLSATEATLLMREPSWSTRFWARPHIAALLEDRADERAHLGERYPPSIAREIERLAREGASSPHADIYRDAAETARAILAVIAREGEELDQLSRDVDPRERARIEASLAALGRTATDESPAKRRMRDLLERQVEIHLGIERRRAEVSARRAYLHEQLRTLALQLARLRSDDLDETSSAEITERLRLLMQEIEARVEAADEVKRAIAT